MTLPRCALLLSTIAALTSAAALAQDRKDLPIHGDAPLPDVVEAWLKKASAPPIEITFELKKPGFVTLVVDDDKGRRVRNLTSETFFNEGAHTIPWDGLDDSAIPGHHPGVSEPQRRLVEPGKYIVRGLVRDKIELRYEASLHTSGDPPWRTPDGKGGWLADHTPPADVLALPGDSAKGEPRMLIGSFVAEAGDGLTWTDLEGRRIKGRRSVGAGGGWWGAYLLARDAAPPKGAPAVYLAGAWQKQMQVWSLGAAPKQVAASSFGDDKKTGVEGLAVRGGLLAVSLTKENALLLVDSVSGKTLGKPALHDPRGLAFDKEGRLLALSGQKLLRFPAPVRQADAATLGEPETIVNHSLDDPRRIAIDDDGNVFVSDQGESHQVKVFDAKGTLLRTIGKAGGARLGTYDPERMDRPLGVAIAADGRLWVAENSSAPRRVSIWTRDGKLVKWLIGSPQYGGGGAVNPAQPDRFLFGGNGGAGLDFVIDRASGKGRLRSIYYLQKTSTDAGVGGQPPQHGFVYDERLYLTNAFNSNPTGGASVVGIWTMRDGIAVPVAAVGVVSQWPKLKDAVFDGRKPKDDGLFAWSDLNDDGKVDADEVSFSGRLEDAGPLGTTYVAPDLRVVNANSAALVPLRFTKGGAPVYDAAKTQLLLKGLTAQTGSSGCGETILTRDDRLVVTGGPMRGFKNGRLEWTYPNHWPSLHAANWGDGHMMRRVAPPAPGLLVGTTHLLGQPIAPPGSDAGEIFAQTGNLGCVYLMTTDGLFVATLFRDRRVPGAFGTVPRAVPGELLNDATPGEEHFYPSMTQAIDGKVYLQAMIAAGGILTHCNVIRVDGLETIRRLPAKPFEVTTTQLTAAHQRLIANEVKRIEVNGRGIFEIPSLKTAPIVDGDLKEWNAARWLTFGELPFHHRVYDLQASLALADGKLFGAIKTGAYASLDRIKADDADPAKALASATAIVLMLETDPEANPERVKPARGDVCLLLSRQGKPVGKPLAILYRPVDKSSTKPIAIRSSWREVFLDRAQDVSDKVSLAIRPNSAEFAIDVAGLGIELKPDRLVRADLGFQVNVPRLLDPDGLRPANLFGADHRSHTVKRQFWHDKSTTFEPDPAGAALLTPPTWGRWRIAQPE